ncbi:hypothetical protein JCM10908_002535 [Rhodotorula pacifica]|uniref:uncharacterized protein n=1 Tax=Rhodotorula pacifica TaxID=1495444 RepID=UPI00318222BA
MSRRASGSKVSYKELDSDSDSALWNQSSDDDDLKALKAAAPLTKKKGRKRAQGAKKGTSGMGDTYGARRPQRKKHKKNAKQAEKVTLLEGRSEGGSSDDELAKKQDGSAKLPKMPVEDSSADDSDEPKPPRKARVTVQLTDDEDDTEIESDDSDEDVADGKDEVRAESAQQQMPRPTFSEELLLKLPFDMFAEICSHLDLKDLVRLAKTSKKLHKILLARNTRPIWARSRAEMGYILPTEMTEIDFAVFIGGVQCQRRALGKELGKQHPNTSSSVRVRKDDDPPQYDQFYVPEVVEVDEKLKRLQLLDERASDLLKKRSLWSTRSRRNGTDDADSLRTDHVIKHQLRQRHGWSQAHAVKLQQGMTAQYVRYPYNMAPNQLPDNAPDAWTNFRVLMKEEEAREQHVKFYAERKSRLQQEYATMEQTLRHKLAFVPVWHNIAYDPAVTAFLSADDIKNGDLPDLTLTRSILEAAAKRRVENERLAAIRGTLSAHLDLSMSQLSGKAEDYPPDVYDDDFFQKVPNRFQVDTGNSPLSFLEYARNQQASHAWQRRNVRRDLSEWRRATRHVLLAAGKEAATDLDDVNALESSFSWLNGPEDVKAKRYTWNAIVEEVIRHGPKGLHLPDLKDIKIIYAPSMGKGKAPADEDDSDDDQEGNNNGQGGRGATDSESSDSDEDSDA